MSGRTKLLRKYTYSKLRFHAPELPYRRASEALSVGLALRRPVTRSRTGRAQQRARPSLRHATALCICHPLSTGRHAYHFLQRSPSSPRFQDRAPPPASSAVRSPARAASGDAHRPAGTIRAADGAKAVCAVRQSRPDLGLMGYKMPVPDGSGAAPNRCSASVAIDRSL